MPVSCIAEQKDFIGEDNISSGKIIKYNNGMYLLRAYIHFEKPYDGITNFTWTFPESFEDRPDVYLTPTSNEISQYLYTARVSTPTYVTIIYSDVITKIAHATMSKDNPAYNVYPPDEIYLNLLAIGK